MSDAEAGASAIYSLVLDELARVEENLRRLARIGVPAATGPGDPHVSELLEYVLDSKGKRIRPAITLLASRFHPHDGELPISMASAVELLHLATLIHDDTVDNSPVRRGRATVSQLWGRDTAVLLGDYVFASSAVFVCDTHSVRIIRRFSETIMEISSGELLESLSKYDAHQSRQQYEERIYRKTASLFQTAAESGAILSGASEETVEALRTYGFNLGMAFQVVDDILDFEGDAAEIGKPVGHDLLNGVLTLPAILLLEHRDQDNPIERFFRSPSDEASWEQAVHTIRSSGVIEECYGVARQFSQQAVKSIQPLPDGPSRTALLELANYIVERRK